MSRPSCSVYVVQSNYCRIPTFKFKCTYVVQVQMHFPYASVKFSLLQTVKTKCISVVFYPFKFKFKLTSVVLYFSSSNALPSRVIKSSNAPFRHVLLIGKHFFKVSHSQARVLYSIFPVQWHCTALQLSNARLLFFPFNFESTSVMLHLFRRLCLDHW